MPESRGKNLSAESIDALLLALGLADPQMGPSGTLETHNNMDPNRQSRRMSNSARKSSLAVISRPSAPFSHIDPSDLDEAQMFGRDYLSDFDICSDLEEDSDMEYGMLLPLVRLQLSYIKEHPLQMPYRPVQVPLWILSK